MLAELLLYALTPAPRFARRVGLLRDSVSLWSRAQRCRRAWQPHEEACQSFVRECVEQLPQQRAVMILGSGLLRDVPIHSLLQRFTRVICVDAVHPLPVRLRFLRHPKIEFVGYDLTGLSNGLNTPHQLAPLWTSDLDLIISANVLSQLPFAFPDHPAASIIRAHVEALQDAPAPVCLLSDVTAKTCENGKVVETLDLLHGITLPKLQRSWEWEVAPEGEIGRGKRAVHDVGGWFFNST